MDLAAASGAQHDGCGPKGGRGQGRGPEARSYRPEPKAGPPGVDGGSTGVPAWRSRNSSLAAVRPL
eukprot:8480372-Lingulodinium_polyedra.AAC.1